MDKGKQYAKILLVIFVLLIVAVGCTYMDIDMELAHVIFNGESGGDHAGYSLTSLGDVNYDGYDDILIGAPGSDHGELADVGKTYLYFGKSGTWDPNLYLGDADVTFIGEAEFSRSGACVRFAGDIDNDGADDIIIGAPDYSNNTVDNLGRTYLIYGYESGWPTTVNLDAGGPRFSGENLNDNSGFSLASAGDVNGDGFDDILIGAPGYDDGAKIDAGKTYLILGQVERWTGEHSLIDRAAATFLGEAGQDQSGFSVSSAGDVNNDGYDDILIGACGNSDILPGAGKTYLILGKATGWALNTPLSLVDASFRGEYSGDMCGYAVAGAGDVNGDDYDDILISSPMYDIGTAPAGPFNVMDQLIDVGKTYLIFGKISGWSVNTSIELSDASFIGEAENDKSGISIASAGNVDGDEYDDFTIGAYTFSQLVHPIGSIITIKGSRGYMLLGTETGGWKTDALLSQEDVKLDALIVRDHSISMAPAGDINGDEFSDILIGFHLFDHFGVDSGIAIMFLSDTVHYVDQSATGAGTGLTWEDAFTTLDAALNVATKGDIIYMAEGDYVPQTETATGDPRSCTFNLVDGVSIFGGFPAGGGGWHLHDPDIHETILTGDRDDFTDNCYHVVTANGVGFDTILSSVTIDSGHANGAGVEDQKGGGMYVTNSSVQIRNCRFSRNKARLEGGGLYSDNSNPWLIDCEFQVNSTTFGMSKGGGMSNRNGSSPVIEKCLFNHNSSVFSGGGMYNSESETTITGCTFEYNYARFGGGIHSYNSADPNIINCAFIQNTSNVKGGGIYCELGSMALVNCIFSGNESYEGGGLKVVESMLNVTNSVFYYNQATEPGGGLSGDCDTISMFDIANSVFWGNTSSNGGIEEGQIRINDFGGGMYQVIHCCIQDDPGDATIPFDGISNNNIDTDPKFVDPNGIDGIGGTFDDDLHLQGISPCVDSGDALCVPEIVETDFDGNDRIEDGDGDWSEEVDMGPFERQVVDVIYVKEGALGGNNGDNWDDAYAYLADAIEEARINKCDIWVATGIYYPDQSQDVPGGSDDQSASFNLAKQVGIYGGFGGYEHPAVFDLADRDLVSNLTILSGDIGIKTSNIDNSYHVVSALEGVGSGAVLDGFTITDGNAAGVSPDNVGGGIYIDKSYPTITNCIVSGNDAENGGGIYSNQAGPNISSCTISNNTAVNSGGGMYSNFGIPNVTRCTFSNNNAVNGGGGGLANNSSMPLLSYCIWRDNQAVTGGGIQNDLNSNPEIKNSLFTGNTGSQNGGAINNIASYPILANCTLIANQAGEGGGLADDSSSQSTLSNCIFWGNIGDFEGIGGGPYYNESAQIFDGTLSCISYCCIQGLDTLSGNNNIGSDPLFIDAEGPDGTIGTADDDLHLIYYSPCINGGDLLGDYSGQVDLDGEVRVRYGVVDMGAYEVFPIAGDFEGDEDVDLVNLAGFMNRWLEMGCGGPGWCGGADIDGDGKVDLRDYGYFAGHWLKRRS
ncbi:MAG: hypothetical protein GY869_15410 [Planctomycetes bacterium]|nr:hypothetical protein [Planctomycetota bacterium]